MAQMQAHPQAPTKSKASTKQSSLYVGSYSASGPRPYNEDNLDVRRTNQRLIALLADGMGGGEVGASVSNQAIKFAAESLQEQRNDSDVGGQIRNAFSLAHQSARNFRLMGDRYAKSGSTLVCTVLEATSQGMQAHVGNIGDSRVYLVRNKHVTQLTTDHNRYEQLIAQGVDAEQARHNPNARQLTYCLGTSNEITSAPNLYTCYQLQTGDALLLCSDGVGEFVSHTDIATILSGHAPELAAQKIVEKALQNQGNDNASAIVINYGRPRGGLITLPMIGIAAVVLAVILGLGMWLTKGTPEQQPGIANATVTPVPTELQQQATSTALAAVTSTFAPPSQDEIDATSTAIVLAPQTTPNPNTSNTNARVTQPPVANPSANPTTNNPPSANNPAATPVPATAPPVAAPPADTPPTNVPPAAVPPTTAPPTNNQPAPTKAPPPAANPPANNPKPTAVPPTVAVPATAVPPTAVPPTAVPPTAVPPTAVPPTAVPPTAVPPTAVPPTAVPPTDTPVVATHTVCDKNPNNPHCNG